MELHPYHFNMMFFAAWVGQPLMCYDQIQNQKVLAVVFIDDELGYCIKSLSGDLEGKKWTVASTILELKGRFDNWREAKQWLASSELQSLAEENFLQEMLDMEAQMDRASKKM